MGEVLILYTETPDTVYVVFGYERCLKDFDSFVSRIGCDGAYLVEYVSLDRDDWSAYNALQTITSEDGSVILSAEAARAARSASVGAVEAALWTVSGLLLLLDGFCFYLILSGKRRGG